jgi:hypothetical protein
MAAPPDVCTTLGLPLRDSGSNGSGTASPSVTVPSVPVVTRVANSRDSAFRDCRSGAAETGNRFWASPTNAITDVKLPFVVTKRVRRLVSRSSNGSKCPASGKAGLPKRTVSKITASSVPSVRKRSVRLPTVTDG